MNAVSDITDFFSSDSHNPLYHLRRYGGGQSDQELQQSGVSPGSWDTESVGYVSALFQTIFEQRGTRGVGALESLYDAKVLVEDGGDSAHLVMEIPSTTVDGLDGIEIDVPPGGAVKILAASTPGGQNDILLATGDPLLPENQQVGGEELLEQAEVSASLVQLGPTGQVIASADVTLVPEPGFLLQLLVGFAALAALARSRMRERPRRDARDL